MKYRLIVSHVAHKDYRETVAWFDSETGSRALGDRFTNAVNQAFENIAATPERFGYSPHGSRRFLLRAFRHAVHYIVEGSIIHIVAIWHESRDPKQLRGRMRRSQ
jgi:toxin ParE1/3/4